MRDRAPAGWPGELIADGMSCPPERGVSTASLGRRWFSRRLLTSANEDIDGRTLRRPRATGPGAGAISRTFSC